MKNLSADSHQNWRTPRWLFDKVNFVFGTFDCDVAATEENRLCERFTPDAFDRSVKWGERNWCNPPYAKMMPWVEEALWRRDNEGVFTTILAPAAVGTKWFNLLATESAAIYFLPRRVQFVHPETFEVGKAPPTGHAIYLINPHNRKTHKAFVLPDEWRPGSAP
jgi:phage N-6-adenine-methyltransferase